MFAPCNSRDRRRKLNLKRKVTCSKSESYKAAEMGFKIRAVESQVPQVLSHEENCGDEFR